MPRMEARQRGFVGLALLGALLSIAALVALLQASPTSAAPASCTAGATSGTVHTYTCDIPSGTIGGYEVRQWVDGAPNPLAGTGISTGYVTHMETDMIDDVTGQQVPISRLMLHHIVFINAARQDTTCAGKGYLGFGGEKDFGNTFAPQRFYAAGEERAKMSLPDGYGYKLNSSDPWAVLSMVMNHRSTSDHALIHYSVTIDTAPKTPVTPYWFDVRDCRADPIYNIPSVAQNAGKAKKRKAGKTSEASAAAKHKKGHGKKGKKKRKKVAAAPTTDETEDVTFAHSGYLVAGAGHVHGGAIKETLTEPGCGNRQVAESDPTWGLADHPFYNVKPILHEPGPINMSA